MTLMAPKAGPVFPVPRPDPALLRLEDAALGPDQLEPHRHVGGDGCVERSVLFYGSIPKNLLPLSRSSKRNHPHVDNAPCQMPA